MHCLAKQLAPRVKRFRGNVRGVRAADRGDYNRFYSEESTACRLWFDAKEQAIFSKEGFWIWMEILVPSEV